MAKQRKVDDYVKRYGHLTPKSAVVGNDPATGAVIESIADIDPILGNKDRVAYEIGKSRERLNLKKGKQDLFTDFQQIEEKYDGYIYTASITKAAFIITFRAPFMSNAADFKSFPVVTDVTNKAFSGSYYLCSSVLYFRELRKLALVFQAVLGGLTEMHFMQYFLAFFTAYKIDFDTEVGFLGMLMDFSAAQRKGFLQAYRQYTFGRTDGLKYLKGCYMHWMQSVQRVSSNHTIVQPSQRKKFLQTVYRLRTTSNQSDFDNAKDTILQSFPILKKWLSWWTDHAVQSMIFRCHSEMKISLLNNPSRTTNAIESYHKVLYQVIRPKMPLSSSLRQVLQLTRSDERELQAFYTHGGLRPTYERRKRQRVPKKVGTRYYIESDSRAPDLFEVLVVSDNENNPKRTIDGSDNFPPELSSISESNDHSAAAAADNDPLSRLVETLLPMLAENDPSIMQELLAKGYEERETDFNGQYIELIDEALKDCSPPTAEDSISTATVPKMPLDGINNVDPTVGPCNGYNLFLIRTDQIHAISMHLSKCYGIQFYLIYRHCMI